MRWILCALVLLVSLPAHAAATYAFWMDSWALVDDPSAPTYYPEFLLSRAKIASIHVTLDDPAAGGWLRYHFVAEGRDAADSFSASGLSINGWEQLSLSPLPVCWWAFCDVTADLVADGAGLAGSFLVSTTNDLLDITGDASGWSGLFASDGPTANGQFNITGRWFVVPAPGTVALLLASAAALRARRRA